MNTPTVGTLLYSHQPLPGLHAGVDFEYVAQDTAGAKLLGALPTDATEEFAIDLHATQDLADGAYHGLLFELARNEDAWHEVMRLTDGIEYFEAAQNGPRPQYALLLFTRITVRDDLLAKTRELALVKQVGLILLKVGDVD